MNRTELISTIKETHRGRLERLPEGAPEKVQRAATCIGEHLYDENLSVTWMRTQCRINGHNFAAWFAHHVGRTPKEFINYHRMAVAKKLLVRPELDGLPMYQIAYEVGFHSLASFDMTFKKNVGCTPTEYCRKHETA